MALPVLVDDSVLGQPLLCDLMLRLAHAGCFEPHWTADVTVAVHRHIAAVAGATVSARRLHDMNEAFPDASVTGHEALTEAMTCSHRYRPVLAAAVYAGCQAIVTTSPERYPHRSTARYLLRAVHPDEFLLDLLDEKPAAVLGALDAQMSVMRRAHLTVGRFLSTVETQGVPDFVTELRRRSGAELDV